MQDGDSQKASGDPSPEASQNAQAMGYPQRKACPVLPIDVHKHTHTQLQTYTRHWYLQMYLFMIFYDFLSLFDLWIFLWGFNCSFMFRTCRCLQKGATNDKSFVKGSRKKHSFLQNQKSRYYRAAPFFQPEMASGSFVLFLWPVFFHQIFSKKHQGLASCGLLDPWKVARWELESWWQRHWWVRDWGAQPLCLERCPILEKVWFQVCQVTFP